MEDALRVEKPRSVQEQQHSKEKNGERRAIESRKGRGSMLAFHNVALFLCSNSLLVASSTFEIVASLQLEMFCQLNDFAPCWDYFWLKKLEMSIVLHWEESLHGG